MCSLLCLVALTGIAHGGIARGAEVPAGLIADPGGPSLSVLPYDETEDAVTVTGQGFTPEGKVYLAIIDQMGKQLYEHRWVTATARATYDAGPRAEFDSSIVVHSPGGELVAKFKGLCGASALIRALDDATERWSSFQVVQPPCASAAGPTVANGLLRPESLPMTVLNPAGATIANDLNTVQAPSLRTASPTAIQGSLSVTGERFTTGGRVYVAIYDQMGAKLYETRWVTATPAIAIGPAGGGALSTTFNGLCGADVLIRAYDQDTALWTNWLESAPLCDQPSAGLGYGPH
jgi:hypothetical protein